MNDLAGQASGQPAARGWMLGALAKTPRPARGRHASTPHQAARGRISQGGTRLASRWPMINANQIKPNTPVVCSKNGQFAVVDHLEGTDSIKLNKDANGLHHYIPLSWVTSIDDKVHIDRTGDQAMREWTTKPKAAAQGMNPKA